MTCIRKLLPISGECGTIRYRTMGPMLETNLIKHSSIVHRYPAIQPSRTILSPHLCSLEPSHWYALDLCRCDDVTWVGHSIFAIRSHGAGKVNYFISTPTRFYPDIYIYMSTYPNIFGGGYDHRLFFSQTFKWKFQCVCIHFWWRSHLLDSIEYRLFWMKKQRKQYYIKLLIFLEVPPFTKCQVCCFFFEMSAQ